MRKTSFRFVVGYALTVGTIGASAGADMILTLEPKDLDLNPIVGGVPPGTRIVVDLLISVDAEDDTGLVISTIDLTFGASSDTIVVDSFSFLPDMSAYFFQLADVNTAIGAAALQCATANCIELAQQPSALGRVEIIVNGPGELNAAGSLGIGGGLQTVFNAIDTTGVVSGVRFSLSDGNLQGGILSLSISDGSPPPAPPPAGGGGVPGDTDGDTIPDDIDTDDDDDGVPDVDDDFPLDAGETVDSDDDGVGDNTDVFPFDASETTDTDGDGIGDSADLDDDNDGVADVEDADPLDPGVTDGDADDSDTGSGGSNGSGPCGIAMVQTSIFIFLGLSGMGRVRRRAGLRGAA